MDPSLSGTWRAAITSSKIPARPATVEKAAGGQRMNRLALALIAASFPLLGADEPLPSVQTVMDHFITATGGRPAWEARHNLVQHATLDFAKAGLKGTLTIYEEAPDKYLGVTELPGVGKIATGSDGVVAWENTALQGPRIKQGAEKSDAFREGAFNGELNWQKLYSKGEIAGVETVGGHECYKVVLTPKDGKPINEFFDKKTGLLVKTATVVVSQMGEIAAEILYDDYRKDGGVLSPHRMVNHAAKQEFVIEVQSVETNVDMPKDRFDLPPEVQALLKKTAAEVLTITPPANSVHANVAPDHGKLTIYMAGNPVATENYTVGKSSDGGIDIDGSGSANLGPMKIEIEKFEVLTNAKYEPVEATAKGKLGAIQMNIHATFAGGQAKNEIDTGQGPQTKDLPVHANAVVVNNNLPLYPWTVLVMRASLDNQQPQQFPVYVIGQAEVDASLVFKARERVEFTGKAVELN